MFLGGPKKDGWGSRLDWHFDRGFDPQSIAVDVVLCDGIVAEIAPIKISSQIFFLKSSNAIMSKQLIITAFSASATDA